MAAIRAFQAEDHFEGKAPEVRAIYDAILKAAKKLGPVEVDPKKTSIHLNRRTAFAGIATRRSGLVLTPKSATDIRSGRITRREKASAHRWHLEIELAEAKDVDRELMGWIEKAYELSE